MPSSTARIEGTLQLEVSPQVPVLVALLIPFPCSLQFLEKVQQSYLCSVLHAQPPSRSLSSRCEEDRESCTSHGQSVRSKSYTGQPMSSNPRAITDLPPSFIASALLRANYGGLYSTARCRLPPGSSQPATRPFHSPTKQQCLRGGPQRSQ